MRHPGIEHPERDAPARAASLVASLHELPLDEWTRLARASQPAAGDESRLATARPCADAWTCWSILDDLETALFRLERWPGPRALTCLTRDASVRAVRALLAGDSLDPVTRARLLGPFAVLLR